MWLPCLSVDQSFSQSCLRDFIHVNSSFYPKTWNGEPCTSADLEEQAQPVFIFCLKAALRLFCSGGIADALVCLSGEL